MKSRETIQKVT